MGSSASNSPNILEPKWETKTLSVKPGTEQEIIRIHETFGWEVLSTQDVKTVDSHLQRLGDSIYSVTEREAYVKLTFRRNKNMPNYSQVAELDELYRSTESEIGHPNEPKIGCLYFTAISILPFFGVLCFYGHAYIPGVLFFIGALVCLILVRKKNIRYAEQKELSDEHNQECYALMQEYLDEAKQYTDSN